MGMMPGVMADLETTSAGPEPNVPPPPLLALRQGTRIYRVGDSEIFPLRDVSLSIERGDRAEPQGRADEGFRL